MARGTAATAKARDRSDRRSVMAGNASAAGRLRPGGRSAGRRGLPQAAEVLREEGVAGIDSQAFLESRGGAGGVSPQVRDVGAVLVDERQSRRRFRRLVELALGSGVVAAARRRRGLLGESGRLLLGFGARLLRKRGSEPVKRADRRLVLRVVLDRLLVVRDRRVALLAALVDDGPVVVRLDVQRLELD